VYDHHRRAIQETKCYKSLFPIIEAIVFKRKCRAVEDWLSVRKVNPVIAKVRCSFRLVPRVSHLRSVYTPLGKRKDAFLPANARHQRRHADVSARGREAHEVAQRLFARGVALYLTPFAAWRS
jgi:hypothetical protein